MYSLTLEIRLVNRFDTSATRGLRSPTASGSGKALEKEKEKEREVSSTEQGRARSALAEITNAAASSAVLKAVSVVPVVHKPVTRSQSAARPPGSGAKARAPLPPSKPPHTGRQLTVPKSPMLLSRLRSDGRMRVKSTEELELERIEKERQALAAKYKRKQQAACEGHGGDEDVRSSKRLKSASSTVVAGGFTVGAEAADVGMRQSTRSSTRAKGSKGAWKPKLTVPQSPAFATNGRVRAPRYKSTEELQLEEIAKVRLAKGGHGKKAAEKAVSNPRPKSRMAPLTIPEPLNFTTTACGAKSTTAARSTGAARAGTRSVKSATAQPTQSTAFVEGPVTRSRAYVVETKKRNKRRPAFASIKGAEAGTHTAEHTNERTNNVMKMNARSGQATRGASMLRGGAMRVVRTEDEDPEEADESAPTPGNPGCVAREHGDGSRPASYDQPKSRGRSIFDSIAGAYAKKGNLEETKRPEGTPSRITFEQLGRRNKFHNPLFEFKEL